MPLETENVIKVILLINIVLASTFISFGTTSLSAENARMMYLCMASSLVFVAWAYVDQTFIVTLSGVSIGPPLMAIVKEKVFARAASHEHAA